MRVRLHWCLITRITMKADFKFDIIHACRYHKCFIGLANNADNTMEYCVSSSDKMKLYIYTYKTNILFAKKYIYIFFKRMTVKYSEKQLISFEHRWELL